MAQNLILRGLGTCKLHVKFYELDLGLVILETSRSPIYFHQNGLNCNTTCQHRDDAIKLPFLLDNVLPE